MDEDLLNSNEIQQILEEAKDKKYSDPHLLNLGRKKTSIFQVSQKSGLILFNGNESTGRVHIDIRHNITSRKPFWDKNNKIGNPSKFNINVAPIDYLKIADNVFKSENKNLIKNKKPDIFDLYIGEVTDIGQISTEYTLILYKGTKLVHTLFVSSNKKPFNKKKVLDLRQGWASATNEIQSGVETYTIPYFDSQETERFKIILRSIKSINKDKWYIQVNSNDGLPIFTKLIKEEDRISNAHVPFRMINIDFSNLTWLEKEIKKLMEAGYD